MCVCVSVCVSVCVCVSECELCEVVDEYISPSLSAILTTASSGTMFTSWSVVFSVTLNDSVFS